MEGKGKASDWQYIKIQAHFIKAFIHKNSIKRNVGKIQILNSELAYENISEYYNILKQFFLF